MRGLTFQETLESRIFHHFFCFTIDFCSSHVQVLLPSLNFCDEFHIKKEFWNKRRWDLNVAECKVSEPVVSLESFQSHLTSAIEFTILVENLRLEQTETSGQIQRFQSLFPSYSWLKASCRLLSVTSRHLSWCGSKLFRILGHCYYLGRKVCHKSIFFQSFGRQRLTRWVQSHHRHHHL